MRAGSGGRVVERFNMGRMPLTGGKEMLAAAACKGVVRVALPFAETLATRHVWA